MNVSIPIAGATGSRGLSPFPEDRVDSISRVNEK